ncbi:hypothetical protein [Zooshikella harenae]|uniref:Uncharacterized protein n=1 Tax=Zooshikella harenae TaxID=2827238 RepID=A0ABS5ZGJ7_9GAMM|nr:hypothetical protein [Zooshikella harenae]MBU2713183.1 hypothetical protein [Zooshikella harenae]
MINKSIDYLRERISDIELELSKVGTNKDLIDEKKCHLESIKCIEFVCKNKINLNGKVLNLPYIEGYGGPFYSFRIVLEEETADRENWVLIDKIDDVSAELMIGDQIITS